MNGTIERPGVWSFPKVVIWRCTARIWVVPYLVNTCFEASPGFDAPAPIFEVSAVGNLLEIGGWLRTGRVWTTIRLVACLGCYQEWEVLVAACSGRELSSRSLAEALLLGRAMWSFFCSLTNATENRRIPNLAGPGLVVLQIGQGRSILASHRNCSSGGGNLSMLSAWLLSM